MDRNAEAAGGGRTPDARAGRSGIWLMAAIAVAAVAIPLVQGALSAAVGVPLVVAVVGVAFYMGSRRRGNNDHVQAAPPRTQRGDNGLDTDVIAALPDPAVLLDADGRVVTMNASASAIAPALRLGEPASLALRIPEVLEAIRRAGLSRKPERIEFAQRAPSERWFEAFVMPLPADPTADTKPRLLLIFHDLTSVRRVEEMRVDFVANASHELRTPLAALSGFIETLKGAARNDAAARERFLDIMEAQAKRMARLIDDLLSLSRIELAAHVRPETPVDLLPIVRQVIDALQMLARDRGVEVAVTAPREPLIVLGDRDELTRVFENLLENALKYGASGKRVDISLARVAGGAEEAMVSFRDYGPGIAAEHLPRLTERFYRIDVTESRAQGGTGLGLALVKHIMNRHRGRLTVESRPGEGATFSVRLPISTADNSVERKTT